MWKDTCLFGSLQYPQSPNSQPTADTNKIFAEWRHECVEIETYHCNAWLFNEGHWLLWPVSCGSMETRVVSLSGFKQTSKVRCDQSLPKIPLNSATHLSKSELNKGRDKATWWVKEGPRKDRKEEAGGKVGIRWNFCFSLKAYYAASTNFLSPLTQKGFLPGTEVTQYSLQNSLHVGGESKSTKQGSRTPLGLVRMSAGTSRSGSGKRLLSFC